MQRKYPHLFTKPITETNTSWIQGLNSYLGGRMSQLTISRHLPFQVIFPNFDFLLFINHYSSKHYSSFYYSSFSRSIWYSEKYFRILLFTEHYSFPEKFSPFTCITHFIVNLVYGYSNSRNRIGLGANSFYYQ